MGHDDCVVVVVVTVCVHDVHHFGEVVLDAHWHCSREEHVVVPRCDEVVHGRRALGYREDHVGVHFDEDHDAYALDHVGVLVADLLGEGHDVHDALVSTLRSFLYDLSVMKKKIYASQGV